MNSKRRLVILLERCSVPTRRPSTSEPSSNQTSVPDIIANPSKSCSEPAINETLKKNSRGRKRKTEYVVAHRAKHGEEILTGLSIDRDECHESFSRTSDTTDVAMIDSNSDDMTTLDANTIQEVADELMVHSEKRVKKQPAHTISTIVNPTTNSDDVLAEFTAEFAETVDSVKTPGSGQTDRSPETTWHAGSTPLSMPNDQYTQLTHGCSGNAGFGDDDEYRVSSTTYDLPWTNLSYNVAESEV